MTVRVTQNMMTNGFMRNLSNIMREMEKTQYMLSSGKKIRLPEDDPVGSVQVLTYRSALVETEKYLDNAQEAEGWLQNTDSALNEVTNVLHRVKDLMIQADTDSATPESRQAIGQEVRQLTDHVSRIANTTVGGRYIFGGTNTEFPPAQWNGAGYDWKGNGNEIQVEIDAKATVPINSKGLKVFATPPPGYTVGLLQMLHEVASTLEAGNRVERLDEVDRNIDQVLEERASIGARQNRLDFTKSRLEDFQLTISTTVSRVEDADMAKVITDLKMQENVFRSALSAGARIMQPSLVDFLR